MNYFDIIVLALSALFFISGLRNGLINELASLVGLLLGIWGAVHFGHWTEEWLKQYTDFDGIGIVAFVITLVVIIIAVHFIAAAVNRILSFVMLNWLNRLCGGVFSVVKGFFFMSCILFVFNSFIAKHFDPIDMETKRTSITYPLLSDLAPSIFPYMNDSVDKIIEAAKQAE